ncbi:MAG: aspartate carbamoyltransferase catalytic subunit [Deltaproteobacteria bacterium]|nr:aspartate carbamoyltransferase catalytic subunit [Deltaproteobacteria bacterium]
MILKKDKSLKQKTPPQRGFFLPQKDLLGLKTLTREQILHILDRAKVFKESLKTGKKGDDLKGKRVINLFFEPSTRTRTSFEIAEKNLSAEILNIAPSASSLTKGESLKDMIENLGAMHPDLLVVRHAASGASPLIASYTQASVINGGDGSHEHPTQGLVDLFTVQENLGRIAGVNLLIVGDIAYSRVARSNIYGFTKMGAKVTVIGPATLLPPGLEKLGVKVSTQFHKHIPGADVIMLLRIQKERQQTLNFPSLAEYTRFFGLTRDLLPLIKKGTLIMHPGPINRGVEIDPEIADSKSADGPQTVILEQVANGVAVRMAVLSLWGNKK